MDAQAFLDNFGTIADAPGGVDRLRDVIRDLAIRGNLGTGDHADEPAPSLLERTAEARSALIAEGSLRVRALPAKRSLQIPFPLPDRWAWSFLAESLVWDLTDGDWVESKDQDPDGEVRLIQLADVGIGDFKNKSARFLTGPTAARLNCTYLSPGDVLIARLPSPLGRSCVFPGISQPAVTVVDVAIARGGGAGMVPSYLALAMNSPTMRKLTAALATGTTRQRVSTGNLRKLTIPVPPLAEQERIVAKVDKLMQLCDDLEARQQARHHVTTRLRASSLDALTNAETDDDLHAAWSRIQTNWDALTDHPDSVDALRHTILRLAVRGKLVKQDARDPDAHQLLRELMTERHRLTSERAIRRRATLPPVAQNEKPFGLPNTWTWVRLDDIGDWGAGATPKRNEPRYFGGPHNWFKSGELNDSPALRGPSEETLTDDALAECSLRLNRVGEVLVAMYGATIGRTAILATEGTTNQAVCACTCFSGFDNEFLFLLLRGWRKELVQMGAGGAQPNISREKIVQSPVPLPPFAEQQRIVKRVTELFRLCDELAAHLGGLNRASTSLAKGFTEATTASAPVLILR